MEKRGLARIEDLAQELVEGTFGRFFGRHLEPLDIVNQLVKVIEDNQQESHNVVQYQVALNPDDFRILIKKFPNYAEIFAASIHHQAVQINGNGFDFPEVRLVVDPGLKRRRIIVNPLDFKDLSDDQITRTYSQDKQRENRLRQLHELDAFLIVQGRRHIQIRQPTLTLGRHIDNDIVLDLPTVSRQHAQIRWRFGKFILYNTSGHGRTLVNGHATQESILRPGDVIALGEALIVYGEGASGRSSSGIEQNDQNHTLARLPRKQ